MTDLRPYQIQGARWLQERHRAMLADDMGLGKSAQLIRAAEGRTLIVAPAMVIDAGVWADEVARWRPDLDATIVPYSTIIDREKTPKGGSRPLPRVRPEYRKRWDTILLDEAHYLKGRHTLWTMALDGLVRKSQARTYMATGTPIPNWAHELYMPLRMLKPGDSKPGGPLGSYWRWVERWFEVNETAFSSYAVGNIRDDTPEGWAAFYRANLDGIFLRRERDDVLPDLPPLSEQHIDLKMEREQRRVYNDLRRDFLAWLDSGEHVVAWSKASQFVKLAKSATGLPSLEPSRATTGSAKLAYLREILDSRVRPTLVVAHFRSTVAACARVARACGHSVSEVTGTLPRQERAAAVRSLREGRASVLVATLDTISEGLTLTAADMVVFVEHSWRPSRNEQALRRIHRLGQDRPVHAVHLWTKATVDIRMRRVLQEKTDQQIKALRPRDLSDLV